ncbi:MAG: inositol monophosphatase family protein [Chitinivibrionales bacterium]
MSQEKNIAIEIARKAGQMVVQLQQGVKIEEKETNNLVTEADTRAQAFIIDAIRTHYPDADFLGEEGDFERDLEAEDLWIIDPIDGTNNYAHSIPLYSISIAYARRGQVKAGVVYLPALGELFSAAEGEGAEFNGAPMRVSSSDSLERSIISTGFYYDRGKMMKRTLSSIEALFEANTRGIRRTGTAALDFSWVACGRFDGYFEYSLSPWDFAAGMLLVREAGGICTDRDGAPLSLASEGVIVSNGTIHEQFLDVVRWEKL